MIFAICAQGKDITSFHKLQFNMYCPANVYLYIKVELYNLSGYIKISMMTKWGNLWNALDLYKMIVFRIAIILNCS